MAIAVAGGEVHLRVDAGRVLAQGSPDEVLANADVRRVYLGDSFRL